MNFFNPSSFILQKNLTFFITLLFLQFQVFAFQQNNHQHQDGHEQEHQEDTSQTANKDTLEISENNQSTPSYDHPEEVTADFEDFPNLHPLVVHIPLIMLLVAVIFQIMSFFVFKEAMSWTALGSIVIGFIGAYLAAVVTHPHVADLPDHAQRVFDTHDTYATWTLWLSGVGAFFKIISHFLLRRNILAESIVFIVFIACAYTVTIAGHHGSQLVFIEGVGPKGNYLQEGDHEHSH